MKSNKYTVAALTLAATAALTACGGGGGGGSAGAPATGPAAPAAVIEPVMPTVDNALVTSVPAAAYAAASEEAAAFTRLNAERTQCGFGLLAQNGQLDAAARAHNNYQVINNLDSHFENQTQFPVGFSGNGPGDRAAAAGYSDFGEVADEFTFKQGSTDKTGVGDRGMRSLLAAPYHLSAVVDGYRDVGMSVFSSAETSPPGVIKRVLLHVNAAYKSTTGKQLIGAGSVATYPCQGSTGVNRELRNETPNPVPGRDLAVNPIGTPIYLATRVGNVLTVATASLKETNSNTSVVLRIPVTTANDPAALYRSHEAYFAPDTSLKPSTSYTASVTGTTGGVQFTKTFSFTTGAQ